MKTTLRSTTTLCAALFLLAGHHFAWGQITYTRVLKTGGLKLHEMAPNGTGDTTINFPFKQVGFPTWSRDGSQLTVTAFRPTQIPTHTWNVYTISSIPTERASNDCVATATARRHGGDELGNQELLLPVSTTGTGTASQTCRQPGKFHLLGNPLHCSGLTGWMRQEFPSSMMHS